MSTGKVRHMMRIEDMRRGERAYAAMAMSTAEVQKSFAAVARATGIPLIEAADRLGLRRAGESDLAVRSRLDRAIARLTP